MGQRHMAYVLFENEENDLDFVPFYNGWNTEAMQPIKLLRFITMLNKWDKNKSYTERGSISKLYEYTTSVHESGLSNHLNISREYVPGYGMHDEDNNNGWLIVYVWREESKGRLRYSIGFKGGSELRHRDKEPYMSVADYINIKGEKSQEFGDVDSYLNEYGWTKPERKIFWEIDKSFDKKKIADAEKKIDGLIRKLQYANKKRDSNVVMQFEPEFKLHADNVEQEIVDIVNRVDKLVHGSGHERGSISVLHNTGLYVVVKDDDDFDYVNSLEWVGWTPYTQRIEDARVEYGLEPEMVPPMATSLPYLRNYWKHIEDKLVGEIDRHIPTYADEFVLHADDDKCSYMGRCPICDSFLDYGTSTYNDDFVSFDVECRECKWAGREDYETMFFGHRGEDDAEWYACKDEWTPPPKIPGSTKEFKLHADDEVRYEAGIYEDFNKKFFEGWPIKWYDNTGVIKIGRNRVAEISLSNFGRCGVVMSGGLSSYKVKIVSMNYGQITEIDFCLKDYLEPAKDYSAYYSQDDKKITWYSSKPHPESVSKMAKAIIDYVNIFAESEIPEHTKEFRL